MQSYLDRSKEFWAKAAEFPANKEAYYPEHGIVQEFDKHTGKVVLEYGCGGGSDTLSYLRRGNVVHYCDIVPHNIYTTRKRVTAEGFSVSATSHLLINSAGLPDNLTEAVDIVSSHGVLHHIKDPRPVMDEFHRVLKPGGLLYLMLYSKQFEQSFTNKIPVLMRDHNLSREEALGWCTDNIGTPYARSYGEFEGMDLYEAHGFKVMSSILWNTKFFRTFKGYKI